MLSADTPARGRDSPPGAGEGTGAGSGPRVSAIRESQTLTTHVESQSGRTAGATRSAVLARYSAFAGLGVGAFMSALDGSIVNLTLPVITRELNADVATIEWVVIVYMLIQSGLLLSFGRLGDLRGHKLVYCAGYVVFLLGALCAGLAPSAPFLVAARALQGFGASAIWSNSAAILIRAFPPEQRGRALGLQAMMVYLGLSSGAPLGGLISSAFGWRAVFLVNIPLNLLALYLSLRFIPRDEPSNRGERFDLLGASFYIVGLVSVLVALNQGYAWGWTSPAVLGCVGLGVTLLAIFTAVERRVPSPMLDLGLFRRRAFTAPVLSAVANYMCTSSTFFLLPFYLIQGRGLEAGLAGVIMIGQPLVMAVTTSLSGALSDRIGSRLPATLGMAILSCGMFLLSRVDEATPIFQIVASLATIGLGVGLFTSPNSSAVMGAVPSERRGTAAGILSTARTLGNVLGIGVLGAVFTTVLHAHAHPAPAAVVEATHTALTVSSGIALLGAITSATRPSVERPARRVRTVVAQSAVATPNSASTAE